MTDAKARQEAKDMTGAVAWLCERGHIDHLHRRSALDLCMTCRDGACEPRATLGRRSKAQREQDRELAETFPLFAESLKKPRRAPKNTPPTEVTVTRGDQADVVDADEFKPTPPTPPFDLTKEQRAAILGDGEPPRIAFPRQPPEDHPDVGAPWPAVAGDVLQVTERVALVVLGLRYLVAEIEVKYEIHDKRAEYGERSRAWKPADSKTPITTLGGAVVGEGEPQPVTRAQATKLADRVHEAELEHLTRTRDQQGAILAELANQPRDVRWPIKQAIKALELRIETVEGLLRTSRHKEVVDDRRTVVAEEEDRSEKERERRELQQRKNAA